LRLLAIVSDELAARRSGAQADTTSPRDIVVIIDGVAALRDELAAASMHRSPISWIGSSPMARATGVLIAVSTIAPTRCRHDCSRNE